MTVDGLFSVHTPTKKYTYHPNPLIEYYFAFAIKYIDHNGVLWIGTYDQCFIPMTQNPNFVAAVGSLPPPGLTYTVAINSLDFSQEPDHEWVELVNVSDDIVDIGDWQLEVGIPDRASVPSDPFKSIWTIPGGTKISQRGSVLLAFNKFDTFQDAPASTDKGGVLDTEQ